MNRSIGLAALALVAAWPVAARQQPAAQPPPVFRTGTNVVEVDVVVHDKNGRFVADLKPDDFEVSEGGKPQAIDLFYRVGNGVAEAAAAPEPKPDEPIGAAAAPAPPHTPRFFIVVFDDDHLSPGGFKRVQAAALDLFEKQFQKGDVGGVLAGGKMANNRLTSDREELIKAVRDAKPSGKAMSQVFDERQWPRMSGVEAVAIHSHDDKTVLEEVYDRACQDEPDQCVRIDIHPLILEKAVTMSEAVNQTTNETLRTLAALMNGLARMDGRKTLLLLSEGFLADESWPFVQQAVGLAARAHATIYTLDARGLDCGLPSGDSVDPGTHDQNARMLEQFDMGSDSVNSLAVDTGGFVVRNTNFFDQAVQRIVDDASNYYVLGYRPEAAPDGKFHKITVKLKRPGLTFRARKGYIATPGPAPTMTNTAAPTSAPAASAAAPTPSTAAAPTLSTTAAPIPAASGSAPVPASGRSAALSGPRPEVPASPPTATGTIVPNAAAASAEAFHLRPNAAKHVEALAANAPDPDADKGWAAYQRGDVEGARASLAVAATRPSARPWVHYALGQASYALRQYQDAVGEWEKVKADAPEFEPVYFDLVDGYIQVRDPDRAIRTLRDAEKRWPNDVEVFDALGVVQVTRGALDDAVKSFEKAIAVAPKEAVLYFNLGKTLELRYRRTRRYVTQTRTWVSNKADLENAITNYKRYLEIGGPLADSAREGLTRLEWNGRD